MGLRESRSAQALYKSERKCRSGNSLWRVQAEGQTLSCLQEQVSELRRETNVNIALSLFRFAVTDQYDRAVVVSGDTDLIPAITAVRATFPHKQIGVILPVGRSSEDLIKHADFKFKMREHHLISSRFPDQITLADKSTIDCPLTWR